MVTDNLDSRSEDPQDSFLVSKNADDPELTLSENDMLDNSIATIYYTTNHKFDLILETLDNLDKRLKILEKK